MRHVVARDLLSRRPTPFPKQPHALPLSNRAPVLASRTEPQAREEGGDTILGNVLSVHSLQGAAGGDVGGAVCLGMVRRLFARVEDGQ